MSVRLYNLYTNTTPPSDLIWKPTTTTLRVKIADRGEVFFANLRALLITLITFRIDDKIEPIDGPSRPISPTSCDMWFFITLTSLRGYILYILYIRSLRGRRGRGPHKTESVLDVTSRRGSGFLGGSTGFYAGNAGCRLRSGAKLCWTIL